MEQSFPEFNFFMTEVLIHKKQQVPSIFRGLIMNDEDSEMNGTSVTAISWPETGPTVRHS
jgi:hypothetical protein